MNTLKVTYGGGITSCLSVRLHEAIDYRRQNGHWPDKIDSSEQFNLYRDVEGQDVSRELLIDDDYTKLSISQSLLDYSHGWQARYYDHIHVSELAPIANSICRLHPQVEEKVPSIIESIGSRTVVRYRGNDKATEIGRTPYEPMIKAAKLTGGSQFIVLTDEQEFLDHFRQHFPDTIQFDLPVIPFNVQTVYIPDSERIAFAIKFLATLKAAASARYIVTNTGNTGIWITLFRGNSDGIWQQNNYSGSAKLRRLGHSEIAPDIPKPAKVLSPGQRIIKRTPRGNVIKVRRRR